MPAAIATSLAASCVVTAGSALAHWRAGSLPSPLAKPKLLAMMAAATGSLAGGMFVVNAPTAGLLLAVVIAQVAVAGVLIWRTRSAARAEAPAAASTDQALASWATRGYLACVGGLTSIGAGGVFLVPFFLWRGIQRAQAAGLASLLGIAIAPAATFVFIANPNRPVDLAGGTVGLVYVPVAMALCLGAVLGWRVGTGTARRTSPVLWTRLLVCVLLLSSMRAIAKML